jgi:hypothetical protein
MGLHQFMVFWGGFFYGCVSTVEKIIMKGMKKGRGEDEEKETEIWCCGITIRFEVPTKFNGFYFSKTIK